MKSAIPLRQLRMKLLSTSCLLAVLAFGASELRALEADHQNEATDGPVINGVDEIRERLLAGEHQELEKPMTVGQWGNWPNYWNNWNNWRNY